MQYNSDQVDSIISLSQDYRRYFFVDDKPPKRSICCSIVLTPTVMHIIIPNSRVPRRTAVMAFEYCKNWRDLYGMSTKMATSHGRSHKAGCRVLARQLIRVEELGS
jgi:hypothetical protein